MTELQRTFKESYFRGLRSAVVSGVSLPLYSKETFEIDVRGSKPLANLYRPEGLAECMLPSPEGDFQSAKALYEAYKGLSPLLASSEAFWAYLTHADLYSYVRERYSKVKEGNASKEYILTHWFIGDKGIFRNALASLWWSIHLSVDEERSDKYELSAVFFMDYPLRSTFLAPTLFIRHKEAMTGVLEFILEHPEMREKSFRQRFRFIVKYFNRLGAIKQITYMDRHFFKRQCELILPRMMNVITDEDAKDDSLLNI